MNNNKNYNLLICTVLVLFAIATRVMSSQFHIWNFASLGALSLFCGAVLKNKPYAFALPLIACLLSDICFQIISKNGFYGVSQLFVYAAMALTVALGTKMKNIKTLNVLGFSIAGSLLFFIISNLGVWMAGFFPAQFPAMYTTDINGLADCFMLAVPFYKNTFISDILFSGFLFGAYTLYKNISAQRTATA